jgi:hypothetical protein
VLDEDFDDMDLFKRAESPKRSTKTRAFPTRFQRVVTSSAITLRTLAETSGATLNAR